MQRLQQESGARIQIRDDCVCITGSLGSIESAKTLVMDLVGSLELSNAITAAEAKNTLGMEDENEQGETSGVSSAGGDRGMSNVGVSFLFIFMSHGRMTEYSTN